MTSSVIANWKLLCSDDGEHWETVHIATGQQNWGQNEVRDYSLGSLQTYLPVQSVLFRGCIAIYGVLSQTLSFSTTIQGVSQITGFMPAKIPDVVGPVFLMSTAVDTEGVFNRYLNNLLVTSAWIGRAGIAGRLNSTLNVGNSNIYPIADFRGRHSVQGSLSGVTPSTVLSVRLRVRIPIYGGVLATLDNARMSVISDITAYVSFYSTLSKVTGRFLISTLQTIFDPTLPDVFTNILIRSPIYGLVDVLVPLHTTVEIHGIVPVHLYTFVVPVMEDVLPFFKLFVRTVGTLNGVLDWPVSTKTFAVTYAGVSNLFMSNCSSVIWIHAGPPITFPITLQTNTITTAIFIRTTVLVSVEIVTKGAGFECYGIVPFALYGSFNTSLGSTLTTLIQIKNYKWFKAEEVNLCPAPVLASNCKGLVLIGGVFSPTPHGMDLTCVHGIITGIVPIVITGYCYTTLDDAYSGDIKLRTLIYGQADATLEPSRILIRGSLNVGRLATHSDSMSVSFRLMTIVRISGAFSILLTPPTFKSFGRIANRGRADAILASDLYGTIKLHVPVLPPSYFGSFVSTLNTFNTFITIRLLLVHGTMQVRWEDVDVNFQAATLCRVTLNTFLNPITSNILIKDQHFVGTLSTITNPPKGNFRLYSRILAQVKLTLSDLQSDFDVSVYRTYRARLDGRYDTYQGSSDDRWNGGVNTEIFMIHHVNIYGKWASTTDIVRADNCKGIVPWNVKGLFITSLSQLNLFVTLHTPISGVLQIDLSPDAFRRADLYGQTNVGIMDLRPGLEDSKCVFTGIAAHAIFGVMELTILSERVFSSGHYQFPLSLAIVGKAKIYGVINAPIPPIQSVYFRSGNPSTGSMIGGDSMPRDQCRPWPWRCWDEIRQELGLSSYSQIPGYSDSHPDKVYWTLQYTVGNIQMYHRFPIMGRMCLRVSGSDGPLQWPCDGGYGNTNDRGISVSIRAHMEIYVTIDIQLQSYAEYNSGVIIWGVFKGFRISGTMTARTRDVSADFKLNVVSQTSGYMAADLLPQVGHMGGFASLRGGFSAQLKNCTANLGGLVPIPYIGTFNKTFELLKLRMQLYTPFQTFGVFRNYYLNELTVFGHFVAKISIYVTLATTLEDLKESDIFGTMPYITGTFVPNSKLDRVYVKILGIVTTGGGNVGFTQAWILGHLADLRATNFKLVHALYLNTDLHTQNTFSTIFARTPIRIFTTWEPNQLSDLTGSFPGIAWPTGNWIKSLQNVTAFFISWYIPPVHITADLLTDSIQSSISGVVEIYGELHKSFDQIILNWNVYHCTVAFFNQNLSPIICTSFGSAYEPALELPSEGLYTVSGSVDNTVNAKRSYFMVLYDRETTELVYRLPTNQRVPFDYTFGDIVYGQYFVLCKPAQVIMGSQVRTVMVDYEPESRFS